MKVVASYIRPTLSILRRVISPFTALASRDYSFHFQQIAHLSEEMGQNVEVVVFQNLVPLDDEELAIFTLLCKQRSVIYDLTDIQLLQNERVQKALELAAGVTVPTGYIKKEIGLLAHQIRELPSLIDIPHFIQANRDPRPTQPIIGCFGAHHWYAIRSAIMRVRELSPHIQFWGDRAAQAELGDLVQAVDVDIQTYPHLVRACAFSLCPVEGKAALDPIWAYEHGILGRPVIASTNSVYSDAFAKHRDAIELVPLGNEDKWVDTILALVRDAPRRAKLGQAAFQIANTWRNTIKADLYLHAYHDMLPHLP